MAAVRRVRDDVGGHGNEVISLSWPPIFLRALINRDMLFSKSPFRNTQDFVPAHNTGNYRQVQAEICAIIYNKSDER